LWADDESRREYLAQVRWRTHGDPDALLPPDPDEYFLEGIFSWLPDEVFVDCGAYTGDTIDRILKVRGSHVSRIVALEPDPANFGQLRSWLDNLEPERAAKVRALPLAVGARSSTLRFRQDGIAGRLHEQGETMVQCEPLDKLLPDESPTYIKFDIEGAEADALVGAESVIRRQLPVLAICLYHRQGDLWTIPLWLQSRFPEYRLFLRSHRTEGQDLVCYAVPPGRLPAPGRNA
jgi:FkbM family methyltransferase